MTQLTQRQESIFKMLAIMDSVSYSGGDWDDYLVAQVDALPLIEKLPGITQQEYDTIHTAYSCPRMVSELISDIWYELEDIEPSDEIKVFQAQMKSVKELETRAKALRRL
jgi:hypothetical protein